MKRAKAVAGFADALAIGRSPFRASRPISTASVAVHRPCGLGSRTATTRQHNLRTSTYPNRLSSVRHESTLVPAADESAAVEEAGLNITALYELHELEGAKFVPFGGFEMPVSYEGQSISDSHHFTRSHCSLFDVSHMVQHKFSGPGVTAFLQRITPASLTSLAPYHSTLSAFLWPKTGGIVDDTIITRMGPQDYYIVTNAGCRAKDLEYLQEQLDEYLKNGGEAVEWEVLTDWGLVALQGPLSEELLQSTLEDPDDFNLKDLYFGQSKILEIKTEVGPKLCLVSRGGYTGEDGFEISINPEDTVAVTVSLLAAGDPYDIKDESGDSAEQSPEEFLASIPGDGKEENLKDLESSIRKGHDGSNDRVKLAGLAARDSLRLEAGMCLYGHDLDDTTTPVEAGLSWIIGKDRRVEGGFHGAEVILRQLVPKSKGGLGVERRRVGFIVDGAPAREGAEIVDEKGEKIGVITSGCPSPTLKKNVAMGYIKDGLHKSGTEVKIMIRGKPRKAVVTKMPFVPSKYWKGPAPA